MGSVRLMLRLLGASASAQIRQPAGLAMQALSQLLQTGIGLAGLWALFARFGGLAGWTFRDVAVFYGVASVAFGCADAVSRGYDLFGRDQVRTRDFDRTLLQPRAAALLVAGRDLRLASIGRIVQGLAALAIGLSGRGAPASASEFLLLAWSIAGGAAIFYALVICQATLAFWTVESLEVLNILTYGGVEAAQYPLDVYPGWFRSLLIYVVPIGAVAYLPVTAALGRTNAANLPEFACALGPLAGFAALAASLLVWRAGERRYLNGA